MTTQKMITVIPLCPFTFTPFPFNVQTNKLNFWHNNHSEHLVNSGTIIWFLKQACIYKPSIFPDNPELGCYAMDNDIQFPNGEVRVHEIYYDGSLIYRRS